jgi:hypothetical protein
VIEDDFEDEYDGADDARAEYWAEFESPYADLCEFLDAADAANRRLRRDGRVSGALTQLRDAVDLLYVYGNGYCEEDVDHFTADWDQMHPVALRRMQFVKWLIGQAIIAARAVRHEIAAHLIALAASASIKVRERIPTSTAPPTELLRSHPVAARAPNRCRVALPCDVLATAA